MFPQSDNRRRNHKRSKRNLDRWDKHKSASEEEGGAGKRYHNYFDNTRNSDYCLGNPNKNKCFLMGVIRNCLVRPRQSSTR